MSGLNKDKCNNCGWVWDHEDDLCPNCGSPNFEDFHDRGCGCGECSCSGKQEETEDKCDVVHVIELKKLRKVFETSQSLISARSWEEFREIS